jgi:hypothetical protein
MAPGADTAAAVPRREAVAEDAFAGEIPCEDALAELGHARRMKTGTHDSAGYGQCGGHRAAEHGSANRHPSSWFSTEARR